MGRKHIRTVWPGILTMIVSVLFIILGSAPLIAGMIPELVDDMSEDPASAQEPARATPPAPTPASETAPTVPAGKIIPILNYHAIENDTFGDASLFVRPDEFERQMLYMKDNGYEAITFDHFEEMAATVEKPFVITFDDGYQDNYTQAYPILKQYGFQAVIFLCPNFVGGGSMLTREQVRDMRDIVSFQSHTSDHRALTDLTYEEAERQLRYSREQVENLTGIPVDAIAYPFGRFNQTIMALSRKYYRYGLMMEEEVFRYNPARLFNIPRIFVRRGMDMETFSRKIQGI